MWIITMEIVMDTMFQPGPRAKVRYVKTVPIDNLAAARRNRERVTNLRKQEAQEPLVYQGTEKFRQVLSSHYRKYRDRLVQGLIGQGVHVDIAEDTVQMAYERALKDGHTFDKEQYKFGTWFGQLLSGARSEAYQDFVRHGMSYLSDNEKPFKDDEGKLLNRPAKKISVEDQLHTKRAVDKIKQIQNILHKKVLELVILDQFTDKEVAELTGTTVNNVKLIVYRFREGLK